MTLLDLVNKTLRRLRVDTVASTTSSTYARLVAEFASEIHQEVALAHDWSNGYKEVEFDTVASQAEYDLSKTTANGGAVLVGSPVATINSEPQAELVSMIYDATDVTKPLAYLSLSSHELVRTRINQDLSNTDQPCEFSLRLNSDGSGYVATLWPVPDGAYRVRIPMWVAEATLSTDGTDDSTTIALPNRPIVLGTLMLAMNERGEEIGEPGMLSERRYYDALAEAIAADKKADVLANRYDFYRD